MTDNNIELTRDVSRASTFSGWASIFSFVAMLHSCNTPSKEDLQKTERNLSDKIEHIEKNKERPNACVMR